MFSFASAPQVPKWRTGTRLILAYPRTDGGAYNSPNQTIAFVIKLDKAIDESSLWETTFQSQTFQEQGGFESKLLACEARFRKIERLTARLDLPDTAVTAVVVDLLRESWLWNWMASKKKIYTNNKHS